LVHQLIDALEYAHERGIIHRDFKPANIKITPDGRVKVLDFGLAKAMTGETVEASSMSSLTMTMRATQMGVILGTAAYMSPEQARGQAVDKRADIWAFGCVLYQMLTGKLAFDGETTTDMLAAVMAKEPDLARVPAEARRLIESCLKKDPKQRLQAIGDWQLLLHDREAPAAVARSRMPWIAAALLMIVAVIGWFLLWRATRPVDHPLTRLSVDLGPEAVAGINLTAAISPDGRRLAFAARGQDGKQLLATRMLDQARPTFLLGTEGGGDPFFSPDGQSIGFFTGELKRIPVQGSVPVTLGRALSLEGVSWGEDDHIIVGARAASPLYRIPAVGGTLQALTKLGPADLAHRWPQVLGAHAVLFTASSSLSNMDNANIEAVVLKTGEVKTVQRGGYYGRYLPSGHLVYAHQGVLFGAKFDLERLEVRGTPVPLLEDVATNPNTGGGQFDFSTEGTFVYAAGKNVAQGWQIAWLDASGKMQPLLAALGAYVHPRLSPDGRKLAVVGNGDIYVHDLERDTNTRLTFTGHENSPVWAPDSKHLIFQSTSNGSSFSWVRSDGAGEALQLLLQAISSTPWSLSREGRLAYFERNPDTGIDLWTVLLDLSDPDHPRPGKPELFLRTPANETVPRFSPDGRWIAYRSSESGEYQIYVRPFPSAGGGKWQISTDGGLYGLWSNNGRQLFYVTTDNRIMVVDYAVEGASFVPGKPRLWSDKQLFYTGAMNLDLAPDGKRFVVLAMPETASGAKSSVHVTIVGFVI
jgi:serine/threonine-protein kinase